MGTGSFPGVKCGRVVLLTTHPLLVPQLWKSRAIPLPTLWATSGLPDLMLVYSTGVLFLWPHACIQYMDIICGTTCLYIVQGYYLFDHMLVYSTGTLFVWPHALLYCALMAAIRICYYTRQKHIAFGQLIIWFHYFICSVSLATSRR